MENHRYRVWDAVLDYRDHLQVNNSEADGKPDALILGHAGNTIRFGLPQHFTIPDLTDEDQPSTREKRKQRKAVTCRECGYVLEPYQWPCPACGLDRQQRNATVQYLDGYLVEFGDDGDGVTHYTQEQKQNWYLAFLWQARRRARKPGWAYYAYIEKFTCKPPYEWRDLPPVMPTQEQARWIRYYEIKSAKVFQKQRGGKITNT